MPLKNLSCLTWIEVEYGGMRLTRRNLEDRISRLAQQAALASGLSITNAAMTRLLVPTRKFNKFRYQAEFDVDQEELRDTITSIILATSSFALRENRSDITRSDLEEAPKKFPCHLLWFC